jgi:hypothetical protein
VPSFVWTTGFDGGLAGFTSGFDRAEASGSHYELVADPTGGSHGVVYFAQVSGVPTSEDAMHRPYLDLFVGFQPGTFATEFQLYVSKGLQPAILGSYQQDPWLSLLSTFDQAPSAGDADYHPSVLVNLVGKPGNYYLQTYSIAERGTYFPRIVNTPTFPLDQWVAVRVEVDVKARIVRTYQNGILVSEGPYIAPKPGLAGAHWGLYANSKVKEATLLNDNIAVFVYPP